MKEDRFLELMNYEGGDTSAMSKEGCNAMRGLDIIRKYIKGAGIKGARRDIIYSETVEALIEAGITEEDTIALRSQNWMIEGGCHLACFV